ncbi:MAG TPA: MCE family protein [Bacteroidetes bacterium]|nr:MCE family protein [Bacteroidota bacterium]
MKNISKEILAGLTAVITILVFIWLFSFLKGNNILNRNDRYHAIFDDIGGLEESGIVEINGYKAGIVRNIKFLNDGSGRLLVTLGINRGYKLPSGTIAEITPESILAGMKMNLVLGEGPAFHSDGDTLKSRINPGVIGNIGNDLAPVINKANQVISDIDTLLMDLKLIITNDMRENLHKSSENIENLTYRMDKILESSGENINNLIVNLDSFATMIGKNSAVMDTTINKISLIADNLSDSDIEASIANFNSTVKETSILLENLNRGKGSAGMFLNDDSLYTELTQSLVHLNLLLEDLKSNPGRYINFSVFGKNK